ncbi:MAG TPA: hypothetical protein PLP00_07765, partial [Rectinema sp.]|nr:hypothetical protein [Rectinema sp.]
RALRSLILEIEILRRTKRLSIGTIVIVTNQDGDSMYECIVITRLRLRPEKAAYNILWQLTHRRRWVQRHNLVWTRPPMLNCSL